MIGAENTIEKIVFLERILLELSQICVLLNALWVQGRRSEIGRIWLKMKTGTEF